MAEASEEGLGSKWIVVPMIVVVVLPVSVLMLRCIRKLHEEKLVDVSLFEGMQHQAGFIATACIGTF